MSISSKKKSRVLFFGLIDDTSNVLLFCRRIWVGEIFVRGALLEALMQANRLVFSKSYKG